MHMYVYCSTVYNSKHMEPTQMPINDRLDKENVVLIHYAAIKMNEIMSFAGTWMKAGSHQPQQTNTGTEEHHTPGPVGG